MMFYIETFKKLNLLFFLVVFAFLFSILLNTRFASAAGIYPYCRGPLQNVFSANNDQFNCPLSGVSQNDSNYSYICTDNWDGVGPPTSGELYCVHYQNSSSRYDCIGSQAGSTNTGSEWWIEGCSLGDTIAPIISNFTATPVSASQINLSWTATDNVGITKIRLDMGYYWCGENGCNFFPLASSPLIINDGAATSYSHTNLLSGTTYRYWVYVYDAANNYVIAGPLNVTTLSDSTPPAQINLSVSSCSSVSCSLSWTAPGNDGNTGTASSYDMRYSTSQITSANWDSATQATGEPASAIAGASQSMIVAGLSPTTTYYFAIKASDGANNISPLSNVPTGTTTAVPDTTAPASLNPNLQAARDATNSSSQINISWNAYIDNVAVVGYRIERCQGIGCSNFAQINTSVSVNYSDSGLSPSTSYSYRIRAYDAVPNFSGYSNIASATTSAPPDASAPNFTPTSPSDPLPAGTTSAVLRGDTNEPATCRYAASSQSFDSMPPMITMATTDGITHSSPLSNLSDNQSYAYYVKCRDIVGNTSNDFIVSFSVAAPPPDTSPPLISGGQPSGVLPYFPGSSGTVTMSVLTNEAAYCRYSQAVDTDFSLMAANSLNTNPIGDLLYQKYHFTTLTVNNGLSYRYYVRCQDTTGPNTNTTGYPIIFSVAASPNILPTVNLSVAPTSGDAPLSVSASGSGNDSDGDLPLTYSLDWGDGFSEVYAPNTSAPHTYNAAGSYTATLTVADSRGGRASATAYITANVSQQVQPPPPITGGICAVECNDNPACVSIYGAGFVCGPSHICVPEAALDAGPVRSGGYASSLSGTVSANFPAGTSAVIIGLTTEADAECRFAVDSLTNNGTANVDYNNVIMKPFSTSDYKNHSATIDIGKTKTCSPGAPNSCGYDKQDICPASGKCDSYGFSAVCRNTMGTLESNTTDYPILFSIGAPELLACVPGEMCPNGLECPSSGRCAPAPYTCSINQFFVKNNIPYLLDICFPGFTPQLIVGPTQTCNTVGQQCCAGSICQNNLTCNIGTNRCETTVIIPPTCTPGTLNCPCNNGSCNSSLTCQSGTNGMTCQPPIINCPTGTQGCPCLAGNTCSNSSLTCQSGTNGMTCQPIATTYSWFKSNLCGSLCDGTCSSLLACSQGTATVYCQRDSDGMPVAPGLCTGSAPSSSCTLATSCPFVSFTSDKQSYYFCEPITLSWSATSDVIDCDTMDYNAQNYGSWNNYDRDWNPGYIMSSLKLPSGSYTTPHIFNSTSPSFGITCTDNSYRTINRTVNLSTKEPVINSFSAQQTQVTSGGNTKFSWQVTGVDSFCSLLTYTNSTNCAGYTNITDRVISNNINSCSDGYVFSGQKDITNIVSTSSYKLICDDIWPRPRVESSCITVTVN